MNKATLSFCACVCVRFKIHILWRWPRTSIYLKIFWDLYLHKSKYNYTYINPNIKCSTPPNIDTYIRRPTHVFGLRISLRGPANSLFVSDKYVTPTGKRLLCMRVYKAIPYLRRGQNISPYHVKRPNWNIKWGRL